MTSVSKETRYWPSSYDRAFPLAEGRFEANCPPSLAATHSFVTHFMASSALGPSRNGSVIR
eukprot:1446660-Amphidinium_carterae.1